MNRRKGALRRMENAMKQIRFNIDDLLYLTHTLVHPRTFKEKEVDLKIN